MRIAYVNERAPQERVFLCGRAFVSGVAVEVSDAFVSACLGVVESDGTFRMNRMFRVLEDEHSEVSVSADEADNEQSTAPAAQEGDD